MAKEEWDPTAMDNAAAEAEEDLNNLPDEVVNPIADWWGRHYVNAGHKRLGRILVHIDKENKEKKGNNIALNPDTGKFSQVVS